jgi:REP element-mobilizing transposase RayT
MTEQQKFDRSKHHRRSIRLHGYDYSNEGLYFLTICCQDMQCFLGHINNDVMVLNDCGDVANECWQKIPEHFPNAILHEYVIMPNHIHGIVELATKGTPDVGAENLLPLREHKFQKVIPRSIASIVKGFKIGVTKWARTNTSISAFWQRNYYEHIIRNQDSYQKISSYIISNPANWEKDKFYR